MDIEEFLHKLSNKMSLIDMGLLRLKKNLTPEQESQFEKLEKANNEALQILRDYKDQLGN